MAARGRKRQETELASLQQGQGHVGGHTFGEPVPYTLQYCCMLNIDL